MFVFSKMDQMPPPSAETLASIGWQMYVVRAIRIQNDEIILTSMQLRDQGEWMRMVISID